MKRQNPYLDRIAQLTDIHRLLTLLFHLDIKSSRMLNGDDWKYSVKIKKYHITHTQFRN